MKKPGSILILLLLIFSCTKEYPSWYRMYPLDQGNIVSISLRFNGGSSYETQETNGLTRLTMNAVLKNSTRSTSREDIQKMLQDMAVSEKVIVDTDVSSFVFRLHRDHFDEWFSLLQERFKVPLFSPDETETLRLDMKESLENRILYRSEDLSRDILVKRLYRGHPYENLPDGHPYSLGQLSGEDVEACWDSYFSVHNLNMAVSGKISREQEKKLITFFSDFHSESRPGQSEIPQPDVSNSVRYILIDNASDVSALSLGWHIPYTFSDPNFYPLWIFASWLGEHRTFYGYFMKELRVKRGFNYGDYAYASHFVQNNHAVFPQPGHPRDFQYFSIWIRPTANRNLPFALRLVLHDLDIYRREGIDSLSYEKTKQFLKAYTKMYSRNRADFLGFEQDNAFYGLSSFPVAWQKMIDSIPYHEANEIIKNNIHPDKLTVVIVGGETDSLREILRSNRETPPVYRTPPDAETRNRDEDIMAYPFPAGVLEQYGTLDFLRY